MDPLALGHRPGNKALGKRRQIKKGFQEKSILVLGPLKQY